MTIGHSLLQLLFRGASKSIRGERLKGIHVRFALCRKPRYLTQRVNSARHPYQSSSENLLEPLSCLPLFLNQLAPSRDARPQS